MVILPAILENNYDNFLTRISQIREMGALVCHIDFCNGSMTDTYTIEPEMMQELDESVSWQAHWMRTDLPDIEVLKTKGFTSVLVHPLQYSKEELWGLFDKQMEVGFVVSAGEDIEEFHEYIVKLNLVVVMGVVIGRQGQGQLEDTKQRILEIQKKYPTIKIELDGGVTLENISEYSDLEYVVAGSSIFKDGNPVDNYIKIQKKINAQDTKSHNSGS